MENKYITVAYKLYVDYDGEQELQEETNENVPFQFISGMGMALDAFEAQVAGLEAGAEFDFTLPSAEAYGDFESELVQTVSKQMFIIDGKFDTTRIYVGAVVPLMNAEGQHFPGTVSEITNDSVTLDLNHPLAGKDLHFVGRIIENREATIAEMEEAARQMSGECGCGGGCGGGCSEGGCGGCSGGCGGC